MFRGPFPKCFPDFLSEAVATLPITEQMGQINSESNREDCFVSQLDKIDNITWFKYNNHIISSLGRDACKTIPAGRYCFINRWLCSSRSTYEKRTPDQDSIGRISIEMG